MAIYLALASAVVSWNAPRRSRPSPEALCVLGLRCTEFDLEAILVLQVGGVVLVAAGVRMLVREQQLPAVRLRGRRDLIDVAAGAGVEREMVEAWATSIVLLGAQIRRLLDHDVGVSESPTPPVIPLLERRIAELGQEPGP